LAIALCWMASIELDKSRTLSKRSVSGVESASRRGTLEVLGEPTAGKERVLEKALRLFQGRGIGATDPCDSAPPAYDAATQR